MISLPVEKPRHVVLRWQGLLLVITFVFLLTNAIALSLSTSGNAWWDHLQGPILWSLVMGTAFFLLAIFKPSNDPLILPIYGLLTGWGILLVDRLAANFLSRQLLWLLIGTGIMLGIAILPRNLRYLQRYKYSLLISGMFILAFTLVAGVNPSGSGLTLWLPVPIPFVLPVYFQPSELLKLLLVIFLASYFADKERVLRQSRQKGLRGTFPYLLPMIIMWSFCMVLLVWQRDLGAATLFFIIFLAMLYVVTGDLRYAGIGLLLLLLASLIAYYLFDVVALRVEAWWNPWPDALDRSFQIVQSLYALAAGGIAGQGIGQGFPTYIPVVHSDFVFAAVSEEWGLIGSLTIVSCFMLLTYRGFRNAINCKNPFYIYLATGIAVLLGTQSLLIMGGVTKLIPLTGVTLPFMSYGGSSMLISCMMLGLLLFISSEGRNQS